jgi:hypothetical protein
MLHIASSVTTQRTGFGWPHSAAWAAGAPACQATLGTSTDTLTRRRLPGHVLQTVRRMSASYGAARGVRWAPIPKPFKDAQATMPKVKRPAEDDGGVSDDDLRPPAKQQRVGRTDASEEGDNEGIVELELDDDGPALPLRSPGGAAASASARSARGAGGGGRAKAAAGNDGGISDDDEDPAPASAAASARGKATASKSKPAGGAGALRFPGSPASDGGLSQSQSQAAAFGRGRANGAARGSSGGAAGGAGNAGNAVSNDTTPVRDTAGGTMWQHTMRGWC